MKSIVRADFEKILLWIKMYCGSIVLITNQYITDKRAIEHYESANFTFLLKSWRFFNGQTHPTCSCRFIVLQAAIQSYKTLKKGTELLFYGKLIEITIAPVHLYAANDFNFTLVYTRVAIKSSEPNKSHQYHYSFH